MYKCVCVCTHFSCLSSSCDKIADNKQHKGRSIYSGLQSICLVIPSWQERHTWWLKAQEKECRQGKEWL